MGRANAKPYSRSAAVKRVFKGAMARKGIDTQSELAQRAGVSKTWISVRLSGEKDIPLSKLWVLDKVLSFTDEEWLCLRDCARK